LSSPAQGLAPTPPPPAKDVETYLVYSIIVMLCCCQPLGIVATVFSAMATGEAKSGQYEAAYQHAQQAKMWCWISFGVGLAFNVIVMLLYGTAIVAGM
jgi:hypothetical protein